MRHAVPAIRQQLRTLLEPRAALAATRVATGADHYVVVTLAPQAAALFRERRVPAAWESRIYVVQPPGFRIGTQPHYAAQDANRELGLARHETLLGRLERGYFPQETAREVLRAVRPSVAHATQVFRDGDSRAAVALLEAALRLASRLDLVRRFLHLYAEIFLMRALALETTDADAALAAYRALIALHAEYPLHHPDTLRAVSKAREAVERLTPVPALASSRAGGGSRSAG